jgi:hypothetical protein
VKHTQRRTIHLMVVGNSKVPKCYLSEHTIGRSLDYKAVSHGEDLCLLTCAT